MEKYTFEFEGTEYVAIPLSVDYGTALHDNGDEYVESKEFVSKLINIKLEDGLSIDAIHKAILDEEFYLTGNELDKVLSNDDNLEDDIEINAIKVIPIPKGAIFQVVNYDGHEYIINEDGIREFVY